MSNRSIKTQKQADNVKLGLVKMTVEHIGCTKEQAEKRIDRLIKSGEIDGLAPEHPLFAIIVDSYITTPA